MPNKSDSIPSVAAASNNDEVAGELFSNRIAKESPLKDAAFNTSNSAAPTRARAKTLPWKIILIAVTALVLGGILLLLSLLYGLGKTQKQQSQAGKFNTASLDLASLNSGSLGNNATVLINGALTVNGPVTAQSFNGNGANLSDVDATKLNHQPGSYYLDASNLDSGTLSDARLSGNVVLLGSSPYFTNLLVTGTSTLQGPATLQNTLAVSGAATFQTTVDVGGDLTVTGDTNINGLTYNWPGTQAGGVLSNDGSGNLAWQPVGACASCITDGGNAFGTSISVGTNDANNLILKTNGTDQVTLDTSGQVGIGVSPGYKLDVNGDVNVAAGNAFRIGGTAICTSGGCAASAGSTDYVQNSASLQTGVNFNFEIASINSVGGIIRAKAGQVADLQQWQDSGGVALAYVDAAGDFSANAALKINGTTVCTASGCTAAGGSGVYIQNGTGLQTTANFNIQSGAAGSVGGVIRGAVGQTANLQEWQDSSGSALSYVDSSGNIGVDHTGKAILRLRSTNSDQSELIFGSGTSNMFFYDPVGGGIRVYVNASERARFNTTGTFQVNSPTNTVGTAEKFRVNTPTTVDNLANVIFGTSATTTKGLVVQGLASQTANLQEWQDSTGVVLSSITASGALSFGTTPAAAGNIRLPNATSISWRNAANSADKSIKLSSANVTDGLDLPGSVVVGGSDATAGSVYFFNSGVRVGRTGNSGFYINTGSQTFEVLNSSKNSAVGIGAASDFTNGTVEKLRVGTVTTVDNSAYATFGATASTNKALVIQGAASQSANLQEWQNSTGTVLNRVASTGAIQLGFNIALQGEYSGGGTFVDLIKRGSSNDVWVGSTTTETDIQAVNYITFLTSGAQRAQISANTFKPTTTRGLQFGGASSLWANGYFGSINASSVGLHVVASVSQTANLQQWEDSSGNVLSGIDASGNLLLGRASGATGSAILYNSGGAGGITLTGANPGASSYTITFPAETGTVCTTASAGACTSAGGFVQLQASTPGTAQTGNLNVSGVALAGTAVTVGTNAAAAGAVRLPNATNISFRNGANSGDINVVRLDASDNLLLNGGNGSTGVVALQNNGISYLTVGASAASRVNIATGNAFLADFIRVSATTGSLGTVEKFRVNTPTTTDNLANVMFGTSATTSKGLVIQGLASQTANLQEWQDSTGAVKSFVDASGRIVVGSSMPGIPGAIGINNYTTNSNDLVIQHGDSFGGIVMVNYGTPGGNFGGKLVLGHADGTFASPTQPGSGRVVGSVNFNGWESANTFQNVASIQGVVDTTSGTGDWPGRLVFNTTPDGSTTLAERMRIDSTGNIYIGNGATSATPTSGVLGATGGAGTNIAGAALTIAGGRGTGTGVGGNIVFQTASASGVSGASANSLTTRLTIDNATTSLYLGPGITSGTAVNTYIAASGSSALGVQGSNLNLNGGAGYSTGTGSAGGLVYLRGGDAGGSGNNSGGGISLIAGASTGTAAGGSAVYRAGSAVSGTGGSLEITAGSSNNAIGGQVTISGGSGGTNGGALSLTGGSGFNGNGGNIYITAGDGFNGVGGGVYIDAGTSDSTGSVAIAGSSGTTTLGNLSYGTTTINNSLTGKGAITFQNTTNSTAAFRVLNSGGTNNVIVADTTNARVGIGTGTTAPTVTLDVLSGGADATTVAQFKNAGATNCTVQPGGTGFACSSDVRLKTNIMNLDSANASDIVSKLQGVNFNWITDVNGQTQVGFIAQDLMKYIPSAVSKDSNGYYVANYSAVVPYLVEAFKKQQTDIDTLKSAQGTSIDVLKTLADAKAVTLSGDLTVGGNVVVSGRTETSADNKGSISIPAGQTSVTVSLPSTFSKKPNINLTPGDFIDGQYRVIGVTKTGFTIELQKAQTNAVNFDWQAL